MHTHPSLFDPNNRVTKDDWVVTQYISGNSKGESGYENKCPESIRCKKGYKDYGYGHSALFIETIEDRTLKFYCYDYRRIAPSGDETGLAV
jgi:hypothetical protein